MFGQNPSLALSSLMRRLYKFSLTTTSGGNLSIRDVDGGIWITPGSIDKGTLSSKRIIYIDKDGNKTGKGKPSVETEFHKGIYKARNDVNAIIHAHSPFSTSFCIQGKVPDFRLIPQVHLFSGLAINSGYATPGTLELRDKIVAKVSQGNNIILLDNHGSLSVGKTLLESMQRFEGLDVCATSELYGRKLGDLVYPDTSITHFLSQYQAMMYEEYVPDNMYIRERQELCKMASRAYARGLMTSSLGSMSIRVGKREFLITPLGKDRYSLASEDIVCVKDGKVESGKKPDILTFIHKELYNGQSEIKSIMSAMPPSIMAYSITNTNFNSRSFTEGYVVLRDIKNIQGEDVCQYPAMLHQFVNKDNPVAMVRHIGALAIGKNVLDVLDKIEVLEVSMRAAIHALELGNLKSLSEEQIDAINVAFGL